MSARDQMLAPDDELSMWIRANPEVWEGAVDVPEPVIDVDVVIEQILSGDREDQRRRSRRRVRRRIIGGTATALIVSAGTLGAAALIRSGQPTEPGIGIICRSAPTLEADGFQWWESELPAATCARLWAAGDVTGVATPSAAVPVLTACIGAQGWIEVFPAGPHICQELDLVPADPVLASAEARISAMRERVVAEVNSGQCVSAKNAKVAAGEILADSGLMSWSVVLAPEAEQAPCVKVVVDSVNAEITIHPFP
jgi:hypothetical protein